MLWLSGQEWIAGHAARRWYVLGRAKIRRHQHPCLARHRAHLPAPLGQQRTIAERARVSRANFLGLDCVFDSVGIEAVHTACRRFNLRIHEEGKRGAR